MQKPIQQLICDVHEEANSTRTIEENLLHATKRMVSMVGRAALVHECMSKILVAFTGVLVILTGLLIWLTIVLVRTGN